MGDLQTSLFSLVLIYIAVPLRLRVLKNGEKDVQRMAHVIGPDLTNVSLKYRRELWPNSPVNIGAKRSVDVRTDMVCRGRAFKKIGLW